MIFTDVQTLGWWFHNIDPYFANLLAFSVSKIGDHFAFSITMNKLSLFTGFFFIFAFTSAQAASGTATLLSLTQGTYNYAVYAQKDENSGSTIYIEIAEAPVNASKASAVGSIPFVGGALRSDVSLEVGAGEVLNHPELFAVAPLSTIETLAGDGTENQPGIQFMKKGVVKFFNDEKQRRHPGKIDGQAKGLYLLLSDEFEKIVTEARTNSNRVIIIIRLKVENGKKGLNAVNVKLALNNFEQRTFS